MAILKVGFPADTDEDQAKADAEAMFREQNPQVGDVTVSIIRTAAHVEAGEFLVRVEDVETVVDPSLPTPPEV